MMRFLTIKLFDTFYERWIVVQNFETTNRMSSNLNSESISRRPLRVEGVVPMDVPWRLEHGGDGLRH